MPTPPIAESWTCSKCGYGCDCWPVGSRKRPRLTWLPDSPNKMLVTCSVCGYEETVKVWS